MNNRVYNALRKSGSEKVEVYTREHPASIGGIVRASQSAPKFIESSIRDYTNANAPQYLKDYWARMEELFGDEATAASYVDSLGSRGKDGLKVLKTMSEDGDSRERALSVLADTMEDIKHEADTKGLNWGSAGSYGASALAMGGLGRLIAGKEHAGWGWGGGILAGLLANYVRRKTYYGKNIAV